MRAKVDTTILRVVLIVLSVLIIISLWGFYSSIRPPKIISSITPRDLKMDYQDVSFKTADGLTLRGWYIPCAKETQKTLILLHGYPADKGNILPALAFLHEDFNLLLFDFRYLGQERGQLFDGRSQRSRRSPRGHSISQKQRGQRSRRVGIFHGWRRGFDGDRESPRDQSGHLRIKLRQPRGNGFRAFRIPVLNYPIAYLVGFWAKLFLGIDVRDASPADRIRNTTIPILLIHSSADAVIPFSHARLLQQALAKNPNAEFWFHEDFAHGQLASDYRTRIKDFFLKHLSENVP